MKAEKVISNISSVLGIISVIGTLVSAFLGEAIAAYVLISLTLLSWLIWLTVKVISLSNQVLKLDRESRPSLNLPSREEATNSLPIKKYLESSSLITSARKNELKVEANFLKLHKCTLLIHVLVPEEGRSLRNAPHNKYIIGHMNGSVKSKDEKGDTKNIDANIFGLKYSMRNQWELVISNSKGENLSPYLRIRDGLEPGWHQFLVAWDLINPTVAFYIDCGNRGSDIRKISVTNWPDSIGKYLCVGAWPNPYDDSYVETRLANFWVCEDYFEPDHPIVMEHNRAFLRIARGN